LNELKSVVEIIDWLDDLFVLRRPGEVNFGLSIEVKRRYQE